MTPFTFADMHNMVAFLSKSDESTGFDQIVDFLNAHTIYYALVVNLTIYVSCIKKLWALTPIKKVNDVVQLRSLIDGKKVVVIERMHLKRGKIEAINADEDITLVDVETQVDINAKLQGRLDQQDVSAATKDVNATEPTVFDDEEVTITMAHTLIKMKAEKAKLFDEQIAQRLHDEEIKKATAREKQEKDDLERAQVLQKHYKDKEENIDWNTVADQIQEKHLNNIKKYQSLKRKLVSIAQARKNIIIHLKNMVGYKMEHFSGMTYDKVRPIFEREYKKVQTLFKTDKDVEEHIKKRVAKETLLQESFKKLKTVEVSGSESTQETPTNDPIEISEEDVQNMLEMIQVSEFKVEALQVKVGGITEAYQSFREMLKGFDREDLVAFWRLVKEKFSTAVHREDKEKTLWVELKTLFKPDADGSFMEASKRRNDVKARTTLLLALPDEHQLIFSKYKMAQELWAAILKTFGGNEATKKTKKNLLKQPYGNFKAEGKETLEQTFNRLQAIVSQLEFMDMEIEQDDLNQKLLTSLSPKWLMHTIVWRNISDLDTMSLDDLYNHLKVYEPEVQKKSDSQKMEFISSSKNSSGNEEDNTAGVPTASTQINEDDIEEVDIKWNMALLSMRADRYWKKTWKKISIQGTDVAGFDKSKVECFNLHKLGHIARECRAPRSQNRGRRDNYRQWSKVEEQAPKALMAIDGVGWDWSFIENEEENHALVADEEAPTEFALMAKTSADSKVEGRLVEFKNQEIKVCEKIRVLEFNIEGKTNRIKYLTKELENLKNEKEGLESKLTGLPEFADDTITNYTRPSPSVESNLNDLQNNSSSAFENGESTGGTLSKLKIKFIRPADTPTVVKTNKVETAKKFPTGNTKFSTADLDNKGKAGNSQNHIEFKNVYFVCAKEQSKPDETSGILRNFITEIENLKELRVKIIRCDNRGEFRNKEMNDFCSKKGIKREFSNARTPQQNRVAERRNMTLIEVARTMVLVNKSQNKTPYELFNGRTHAIRFFKPFGYHVMNLNTLDNLGKFEAKGDKGIKEATGQDVKKDVSSLRYIVLLNWFHEAHLESSTSNAQDTCSADAPESSGNSNPTATLTNPLANHIETLAVETPIPTVLKNKKDKRGIVIKNKARLVAQGHTQKEGIDYNEVFAPIARTEAIRLFLAYASFMGFTVYQMDMKSAFLYGTIDEEVYVMQPPEFQDLEFPAKAYKVEKAMYGLHQAPRAWYDTLSKYLLTNGFQKGDILKKFRYLNVRSTNTPKDKENPWGKDRTGKDVDLHHYRSMTGSLMYLTSSRLDIMFVVCACARHQVTPKECHLHEVRRIFRYLKGHPKLGLWYPKKSPFDLVAYSDSDYYGAFQDRKSTTGGCHFLSRRLISWQCKKQTVMATSKIEAEYVAAASCYGQVLWIQNHLLDYGYNFMNTKIYIDNNSAIYIVKNPVYHSKAKHIEIRHHFIRDCFEKKLISVDHIHTDENIADLLTKPFDAGRFQYLVVFRSFIKQDNKMKNKKNKILPQVLN
nr:hypothetical protein [Tanacetum cinerariifolium]